MIFPAFRLLRRNPSIAALYGAIVAQARSPVFYRVYGVPDTIDGRFELIVLHTVLVFRRLAQDPRTRKFAQGVFDQFCRDMDRNLRELGVGDLAVPRRMQEMGEAYYGRAGAYELALACGDTGMLVHALAKNIFSKPNDPPGGARRLAAYVTEAVRTLADRDDGDPNNPRLRFPDAESVIAVEAS